MVGVPGNEGGGQQGGQEQEDVGELDVAVAGEAQTLALAVVGAPAAPALD